MAPWVKSIFVEVLPKFLFIERPTKTDEPGPFDPLPMPSDRLSQHGEPDDDVEEEVIENCSQHSSMFFLKIFKGQLISECLFDILNFPKNHRKI